MTKTYAELLQEAKSTVRLITIEDLRQRLISEDKPTLLDVRERDELRQGYIPGAVRVPRSYLEMQIEERIPDRSRELVVYCAGGVRSAFAARVLMELGYENVCALDPGFSQWKDLGHPIEMPPALSPVQLERYRRHILLPEVGEEGQRKLLDARVLLLGAGGLGSPAALYLAAAGVGTLGLVDNDQVDASNLQRQIIHDMASLGAHKVDSARARIEGLNPDVHVLPFRERLTRENIDRIFDEGWDVIIDGLDNFPTRYLVNDAAVWKKIPVVHGSIFRFDGQVTTFWSGKGPCYRCLHPKPPPPHHAPSCAEAGVLGILPGIVGTLQATEALKIILSIGDSLVGRLLTYESRPCRFTNLKLERDPNCPVCGDAPTIDDYVDYAAFCAGPI